ncbi:MAG: phosphoribosyltransferase family protein [bacterium]|nr:phosphoribosyltransferase family protein [bacterium]
MRGREQNHSAPLVPEWLILGKNPLLMGLFGAMLDFLFPLRCEGCGREGAYLCEMCLYALPRARAAREPWIAAIYEYRSPAVQGALWKLKYRGVADIAGLFGKILYDLARLNFAPQNLGGRALLDVAEKDALKNHGKISLVPVPLSERKARERGYNQAELLARAMAREDAEGLFSLELALLARTKDGRSQMSIRDRSAREANVRGAFAAHETAKGRRIVLVDDIATTGATLRAARDALLAAGAREVTAVVVAH